MEEGPTGLSRGVSKLPQNSKRLRLEEIALVIHQGDRLQVFEGSSRSINRKRKSLALQVDNRFQQVSSRIDLIDRLIIQEESRRV